MRVTSKEREGEDHLSAPPFSINIQSLSVTALGDWHIANPVLLLQY